MCYSFEQNPFFMGRFSFLDGTGTSLWQNEEDSCLCYLLASLLAL